MFTCEFLNFPDFIIKLEHNDSSYKIVLPCSNYQLWTVFITTQTNYPTSNSQCEMYP